MSSGPSHLFLKDAVSMFLRDRETNCSRYTLIWYRQMLLQLAAFHESKTLAEITKDDLNAFIIYERTRERSDLRPGNLSATTIGHHVRALKAFFKWCIENEYLYRDPSVRFKPPRSDNHRESLTTEQVHMVRAKLESGTWPSVVRDRALVFFFLETGCRATECLSLTLDKVNLDAMYADVLGKGNKTRRVGFTETTRDALRAYLAGRENGFVFMADYLPNPVLKAERPEKKGKPASTPLKYEGLRMILRRLSDKTDVPLYCHVFRRTFGTLAVAGGMDPSHVQTALGHASIEATYLYVQAARANAAVKAQRLYSPLAGSDVSAEVKLVEEARKHDAEIMLHAQRWADKILAEAKESSRTHNQKLESNSATPRLTDSV